jgi:GNAT superfamily N-acetyltransferase
MPIQIRAVTDPHDPAIAAFGEVQDRTFPEPDMLIPPAYFPRMLATQTAERRNLMLVAEQEGAVVGGALFHYLAEPNSGFSSFMAVAPEVRGQGVARTLHTARFARLDEAAGAAAPVSGIFIDVVAPERLTAAEVERERSVGADPWVRRRIFQRLGFRRVDVAYYQPPEGSGGEAITNMDLLYAPRTPADVVPAALVVRTMRAYWTPWLGRPVAERHAEELRRRCGGEFVALRPADQSER